MRTEVKPGVLVASVTEIKEIKPGFHITVSASESTSDRAPTPSGAWFRLSYFFMEIPCAGVRGSLWLNCLRCRKMLNWVQLFRHLLRPRQRKHLMKTLVCSHLRHARVIILYSVNNRIITIQWNCEIKHCNHLQTPQENGNTCLWCLRHAYLTCPMSLPQHWLGCFLRRLRLMETLVCGVCGISTVHAPVTAPAVSGALSVIWQFQNYKSPNVRKSLIFVTDAVRALRFQTGSWIV